MAVGGYKFYFTCHPLEFALPKFTQIGGKDKWFIYFVSIFFLESFYDLNQAKLAVGSEIFNNLKLQSKDCTNKERLHLILMDSFILEPKR